MFVSECCLDKDTGSITTNIHTDPYNPEITKNIGVCSKCGNVSYFIWAWGDQLDKMKATREEKLKNLVAISEFKLSTTNLVNINKKSSNIQFNLRR